MTSKRARKGNVPNPDTQIEKSGQPIDTIVEIDNAIGLVKEHLRWNETQLDVHYCYLSIEKKLEFRGAMRDARSTLIRLEETRVKELIRLSRMQEQIEGESVPGESESEVEDEIELVRSNEPETTNPNPRPEAVTTDQEAGAAHVFGDLHSVKPDSERLNELLPDRVNPADSGRLYVVDRDDATLALWDLHLMMYQKRQGMGTAGPSGIIPLLDSPYGTGKTTFAQSYLALVSSRPLHHPLWKDTRFAPFQEELRQARSLLVKIRFSDLSDKKSQSQVFSKRLAEALFTQWKVSVPDTLTPGQIVHLTSSSQHPMFLIVDDVGHAFSRKENPSKCDSLLSTFVSDICIPLQRLGGLYMLLSGCGDFIEGIANNASNKVHIQRIHLNPLNEDSIRSILRHSLYTSPDGKENDLENAISVEVYAERLLTKTKGHPKSVWGELVTIPEIGDAPIRKFIERYPGPVKRVAETAQTGSCVDVHEVVDKVSLEFVISRMQMTYNFKTFTVSIPPATQALIDEYLMPFGEYVRKYAERDRGENAQGILMMKWFQSVFPDGEKTCSERAPALFPPDCRHGAQRWSIGSLPVNAITHNKMFRPYDERVVYWPQGRSENRPELMMCIRCTTVGGFYRGENHMVGVRICGSSKSVATQAREFGDHDSSASVKDTLILLKTAPLNPPGFYGWREGKFNSDSVNLGVIDLTTREKRNDFFSLALPPGDNSEILDLIESVYL